MLALRVSRVEKKVSKKTGAKATAKQKATATIKTKAIKASAPAVKTAKSPAAKKVSAAKVKVVRKTAKNSRAGANARPAATAQDPIQFPEEHRPLPKTRLTDIELDEFRQLLVRKRAELVDDLDSLEDEALKNKGAGNGDHSTMPIHMADLGSDNWEQEFTLGLLASERALVCEINDALERIEDRTYGVCVGTRKRITKARLRAKPWAKYCIEYARAREEGRAI